MIDHVGLDLTEAMEEAAKALAKVANVDWDTADDLLKLGLREYVVVPINAAAPYIVKQVLDDIASRTYYIT